MSCVLADAIALAHEKHEGHTDLQGQPFIGHPLRVMAAMSRHPQWLDDQVLTAAVLHDIVEDTDVELMDLKWCGWWVMQLVDSLTRRDGEDYETYIDRLIADGHPAAWAIKLADIEDNLDPRRTPSEAAWPRARYLRARAMLVAVTLVSEGAATVEQTTTEEAE